ncbi:MAG: type II secretion system protein [Opitutae bacterium]|nr:type II secretion system protein [Opitutae bacterium]
MKTLRPFSRGFCPPDRAGRGFALVEIGFVLLIAVLGLAVLFTVAGRIRQRRDCDRFIHDVRLFSAALEDFRLKHQAWPPTCGPDDPLPPELAAALKDTRWAGPAPFGGRYGWVAPDPRAAPTDAAAGRRNPGVIVLTAFHPGAPLTLGPADLRYIDSQLDDGNPASGRFRTGFNGWPVYQVESRER